MCRFVYLASARPMYLSTSVYSVLVVEGFGVVDTEVAEAGFDEGGGRGELVLVGLGGFDVELGGAVEVTLLGHGVGLGHEGELPGHDGHHGFLGDGVAVVGDTAAGGVEGCPSLLVTPACSPRSASENSPLA